jgi:SAM-dependent methyltransferase
MSEARARTIAAYQADAAAYAAGTAAVPESMARDLDEFASRVGAGGRVLEIGSGPGRDAGELEARGLLVRRTDVTPAFVDLIRAAGHDADVLDPLTDDLGGPYDGVWANAVLLHLSREELPVVLARLHAATVPGAMLFASLKEGDGEAWSTHGRVSAPRHFTFWREAPLRKAFAGAGWRVAAVRHTRGSRDDWLDVYAERP